jgi:hypothetical protein
VAEWLKALVCETAGIYYADSCGHNLQKDFALNERFTRCPICHQAVRWQRFGNAVFERQANSNSTKTSNQPV